MGTTKLENKEYMVLVRSIINHGGQATYKKLFEALLEHRRRPEWSRKTPKKVSYDTVRQMIYSTSPHKKGGKEKDREKPYTWMFTCSEDYRTKISINWFGWAKELHRMNKESALKAAKSFAMENNKAVKALCNWEFDSEHVRDSKLDAKHYPQLTRLRTEFEQTVYAAGGELVRAYVSKREPDTIKSALESLNRFIHDVLMQKNLDVDLESLGVTDTLSAKVYLSRLSMYKVLYSPDMRIFKDHITDKPFQLDF